ncbi:hypothetical protein [Fictibacillus barbaricus]|nr:hypothetical protein [Fictibacillus barbaricus]GGB44403.1 hypothetical protein GCM10007199_07270 [Fictibacillus barbaricus]
MIEKEGIDRKGIVKVPFGVSPNSFKACRERLMESMNQNSKSLKSYCTMN